jgi:hypothetical protein
MVGPEVSRLFELRSDPARDLAGQAGAVAEACHAMAVRFHRGGKLIVFGTGGAAADAQHVAVEFVHPVIVGKRALPAEAIIDPDPIAALRVLVDPGDVLVVIAGAEEDDVRSALCRAQAWGVETIWIGAGARPPAGAADHVLWLDDRPADAAYTGEFVLLYHLLWELTHVCLEHPGLLEVAAAPCDADVCITCGDEGRLGEVEGLHGASGATVRTASGPVDVDTTLVGPVAPGDLLVVHAGTAIGRMEERWS